MTSELALSAGREAELSLQLQRYEVRMAGQHRESQKRALAMLGGAMRTWRNVQVGRAVTVWGTAAQEAERHTQKLELEGNTQVQHILQLRAAEWESKERSMRVAWGAALEEKDAILGEQALEIEAMRDALRGGKVGLEDRALALEEDRALALEEQQSMVRVLQGALRSAEKTAAFQLWNAILRIWRMLGSARALMAWSDTVRHASTLTKQRMPTQLPVTPAGWEELARQEQLWQRTLSDHPIIKHSSNSRS